MVGISVIFNPDTDMIKRLIEPQIIQSMKDFHSVTIYGPRQCGKTTTVRNLFPDFSYADLEDLNTRKLAQNDPVGFFARFPESVMEYIKDKKASISCLKTGIFPS